ncbi:hypothetical protein OGM63_04830 [Plectonema radiosum NIES-515]|uniref:LapA family protein n=1 Tax=Plectonema radiosum NIES-515 TaxID=2986073 RepID=A0ABT3AUQ2_9CYAN|nr:hypothetical protein [Plectonema radiosum]MCV3212857.1 hypothetical protein [Plectonema radiosum NIES-515]
MDIIRLILLVAVLAGLTLLLAQNWSPVLPLVFLGIRTQPLPLAMWILFSTTAGAVTSVFISSLFNFSTYLARQQPNRLKSPAASPRNKQTRREETFSRSPVNPPPPASTTESRSSDDVGDDWDTNNTTDDDWDFEEKSNVDTPSPENTQDRDQSYERQQKPKSSSQSGSVYSYSYRQPKNSGVGKTESVYDADYRVIIPPYQPPTTTNQKNDDDDWGFFDQDDSDS